VFPFPATRKAVVVFEKMALTLWQGFGSIGAFSLTHFANSPVL
jgi:hypothetical protein